MGIKAIAPGDTTKVIPADDTREYYATLTGASVQLGRTKAQAENEQSARPGPAGDKGPIRSEENEEVWVHNPEENQNVAILNLDHNGFWWEREPRDTVGAVLTSADNEAAPANDEDAHDFSRRYDVAANGDAVETLEMPDAAESLVTSVDDASGTFEVVVEFLDEPGGNVLTTRDSDNSGEYSGGSASDVFVETLPAGPHVRVRITDTSGAANNTLDYSIYAR